MKVQSNTDKLRLSLKLAALSLAALTLFSAPSSSSAQGVGYWHTSGNQILDTNGNTVRIAGISWFGFETKEEVAHGLAYQDYRQILHTISMNGFNTVRLPFSNQMIEKPIVPPLENSPDAVNSGLAGLSSLQILDKIITAAGAEGLKVILDNHRSEAGNSNEPSGLWYTSDYPERNWIADWEFLIERYQSFKDPGGNPIVIGVDLRNEPFTMVRGLPTGSCWTGDTTTGGCPASDTAHNWPQAAGRAATAILNINPNLLVFVEGVDCYSGSCNWQGGNLEGAGAFPVELPFSGHLVYSAHDYGPDVSPQPWFTNATTNESLQALWVRHWAYLSIGNIAPVWLGEFGTTNTDRDVQSNTPGSQGQWFSALVNFLRAQPRINWSYWAVNGEDRTGLLLRNYAAIPPNSLKLEQLETIQFPLNNYVVSRPQTTAEDTHEAANRNQGPRAASALRLTAALSLTALALVLVQQRKPRRRSKTGEPSSPVPEVTPPKLPSTRS